MSQGRAPVEKLADEGVHLKCLQAVVCKKARSPAEKFQFGKQRGRGSYRRKKLKHQRVGVL